MMVRMEKAEAIIITITVTMVSILRTLGMTTTELTITLVINWKVATLRVPIGYCGDLLLPAV